MYQVLKNFLKCINTFDNLHIYFRENETKHLFTYKWKYINIVNSSNFFLSAFEEIESCVHRAETANVGMWLCSDSGIIGS